MARVLAALAAAAMVVGAVVVRSQVIEGDDRAGDRSEVSADVVCATELPDLGCTREEDLANTADALSSPGTDVPTWITPGPWPQMVDEERTASAEPRAFESVEPIAMTELVAVIRERPATCAEQVTWKCLAQSADPAAPRPALAAGSRSTSVRLLALAAMFGGLIDNPQFVSNDFDERPAELQQLQTVDRVIESGRARGARSLAEFLLVPGADVFITTGAEARAVGTGFEVLVPEPTARVVATAGTAGDFDAGDIRDSLIEAGWEPTSGQIDTGLPSPGVLLALREAV